MGEQITTRLNALKQANQLERGDYYATGTEIVDLDNYENAGYNQLIKDIEEEDFSADLEGGDEAKW